MYPLDSRAVERAVQAPKVNPKVQNYAVVLLANFAETIPYGLSPTYKQILRFFTNTPVDEPPPSEQAVMDGRFRCCYEEWIAQQKADLEELLVALPAPHDEAHLRALVARSMQHYEEYSAKRRALSRADATAFFCPAWCASIESSLMWAGGCRPTVFIRLLYALTGSEVEAHLDVLIRDSRVVQNGGGDISGLARISARQLALVNDLHRRTLEAEDGISARMATLQEDVADKPLLPIVRDLSRRNNGEGAAAIEGYAESLSSIMEAADGLRVQTVKEMVTGILTPLQAVELLASAKQLHFAVHELGQMRDHQRGRA